MTLPRGTLAHRPRRRGRDPIQAVAIAATLVIHGGIAAGIALSSARPKDPVIMPRDFMVAKIVRLGKKKPKELLPTIPVPPPPAPVPKEAVKLTENEAAKAEPKVEKKEKPSETKPADFKSALARARTLGKLEAQAEQEGDPAGDPSGNSDTAAAGDLYATQIYKVYHEQWNIPQLASAQGLSALARIFVASDGSVLKATLTKSSGNGPFDSSVAEVLAKVKNLPPPPRELALRAERSGLPLEFAP